MSYTLDFIDGLEQSNSDLRNQLQIANETADKWRDEAEAFRKALEKIRDKARRQ